MDPGIILIGLGIFAFEVSIFKFMDTNDRNKAYLEKRNRKYRAAKRVNY